MRGFLIFVVILLGVLIVVDRVGVSYAEGQVASGLQMQLELNQRPGVDINGFPVLTQAIAGDYRDVGLRLDKADLGELSGLDVAVRLQGVHVPLSDLVSGNVDTLPVDVISGTVTIPYDQVAAQIGPDVTVRNSPDGVVVTQVLDVLGQQLSISGTGRLSVDGGNIDVTVTGLNLAGLDIPGYLIDQLQSQLSFTYTVPALPLGLRITDVRAGDTGLAVSARTTDAVLDSTSIPPG